MPDEVMAATADVYKAGVLAAQMWRHGDDVHFQYVPGYEGPPVASTLPLARTVVTHRMQTPTFFAGLLPEGESRRRTLARALHVAEDDELGLLLQLGTDTIGDVQILPAGTSLPPDKPRTASADFSEVSFAEMWLPDDREDRSVVPGVQPKISPTSRSLIGGRAGRVILKFSPDTSWHGLLHNEQLFMSAAKRVGLTAPAVEVVTDADGSEALAVTRFDRSVAGGRLVRHAQEDATQLLDLRPGQKYDPDAREVIAALAGACAAPRVATRDVLHQMLYSYAVGNNDLHAKNVSVGQDPASGMWKVTPIYDVLHTWPYESDHRFHPAVRERTHDAVTGRHWAMLADEVGLPAKVLDKLLTQVTRGVGALTNELTPEGLRMPQRLVRDVRRRIVKRVRDLEG